MVELFYDFFSEDFQSQEACSFSSMVYFMLYFTILYFVLLPSFSCCFLEFIWTILLWVNLHRGRRLGLFLFLANCVCVYVHVCI